MISFYKNKLFFKLLIILFLIACFSGCGTESTKKLKVRVGYFPNITHIQAVVGLSEGYFNDSLGENVEIQKKLFNAGPEEVEAFMANELDIGYIGPVPAINCFSKTNGEIRIIGGACNNGALLLTNADSGINSVAGLSGKKIAVPQFGNTQDILLRRLLEQNNLSTFDKGGNVAIIQSENANILTLLDRKHIDAALVPEPWGSMIEKRLKVNKIMDSKSLFDGNDYSTTVVIASKRFINEHPEIVKKWMDTHREITGNIQNDNSRYIEKFTFEIKKLTGQSLIKEEISSAMKNVDICTQLSEKSIQSYIDYLHKTRMIDSKVLLNEIISYH